MYNNVKYTPQYYSFRLLLRPTQVLYAFYPIFVYFLGLRAKIRAASHDGIHITNHAQKR